MCQLHYGMAKACNNIFIFFIAANQLKEAVKHQKKRRNKYSFIPVDSSHKNPSRKDMVYFEDSPDFCMADNDKQISEGRFNLEACDANKWLKSQALHMKQRKN